MNTLNLAPSSLDLVTLPTMSTLYFEIFVLVSLRTMNTNYFKVFCNGSGKFANYENPSF